MAMSRKLKIRDLTLRDGNSLCLRLVLQEQINRVLPYYKMMVSLRWKFGVVLCPIR